MRAWPLLVLLAAGCERDPTFFGYWDIAEIERDGVVQEDAGFFEVGDDASIALFLRYRWTGAGFEPDPSPQVVFGETDAVRQEFLGNYQSKGEVHQVLLGPFGVAFLVEQWFGDRAVLAHDAALWPGQEPAQALPTVLSIAR